MASLQVRELPENIYNSLIKQAKAEHRSLAQEAVAVLAKGLNISISGKSRRAQLLKSIENNHIDAQVKKIDPVELLREDRGR